MGFVSVIAGTKATAVAAQRGRRDASAPGDSENTSASSLCVFMEEREGSFVLEGTGKLLSEPFEMETGSYRIEVALSNHARTDSGFWVDFISREDGEIDDYFSVSDSEGAPEFASGMIEFTRNGEDLAEQSSFRGDWKIVLSPI